MTTHEATQEPVATLDEVERRHVDHVLAHFNGNKVRAARALGINRRTLYRKLERWGQREQA